MTRISVQNQQDHRRSCFYLYRVREMLWIVSINGIKKRHNFSALVLLLFCRRQDCRGNKIQFDRFQWRNPIRYTKSFYCPFKVFPFYLLCSLLLCSANLEFSGILKRFTGATFMPLRYKFIIRAILSHTILLIALRTQRCMLHLCPPTRIPTAQCKSLILILALQQTSFALISCIFDWGRGNCWKDP